MKFKSIIGVLYFMVTCVWAQENQKWNSYFSYQELVALAKGKDVVFGATPSALLRFDIHQNRVQVYNSISGLKTNTISALHFSEVQQKLLIGNEDGSLTIFDLKSDRMRTVLDIKNKPSLQVFERRINAFLEIKGQVYIATNYGISLFNLNSNTFGDSFYIGKEGKNSRVKEVMATSQDLFAITNEGIKQIALSNPNKVDYRQWNVWEAGENWETGYALQDQVYVSMKDQGVLYALHQPFNVSEVATSSQPIINLNETEEGKLFVVTPSTVFTLQGGNQLVQVISDASILDAVEANGVYYFASSTGGFVSDAKAGTKESLSPEESNRVFSLLATREGTWFISGGYDKNTYNPYVPTLAARGLSYFNKKKGWEFIPFYKLKEARALTYATLNPKNDKELYIGSYHSGLLQIKLSASNVQESEITLFTDKNTGDSGLENLEIDPQNTTLPEGYVTVRVNGVIFDKQGKLWVTNNFVAKALKAMDPNQKWQSYYSTSAMFDYKRGNYGRLVLDKNNTKWIPSLEDGLTAFNETKNNRIASLNTDLGNLPSDNVSTIALDKGNQLWIGTNKGLRVIQNVDRFLQTTNLQPTNIVIEENGIAEELFYQQYITKIEVDGANRKWVAIADAGVFLVSPTGKEVVYHFTKDNSPLPSNTINDIATDPLSGEVFFATDLGVVSFMADSSEGQETNSGFYAYPNPVRPEYLGEVRLVGLMDRSVVKITDIEGNLVFESTANGGTVVWDTHALNGKRVSSGVYLMMVSSDDQSNTKVKKINDYPLMVIQTKAIVLQTVKYQDKSLIVRCLTKEVGLQSFFVRNAFAKGKSAAKIAYFQPLMLLDIHFSFKNKGGMEYFKEVKVDQVYQSLYYDFSKNSIAIFVSEILSMIVSEQERDEQFYDFIEAALLWLDTHEKTANFHLLLLVELTKYIGFYPDSSAIECHYFDWLEGCFTNVHSTNCLDGEETFLLKRLLELGFDSDQEVFSSRDRKALLAILMKYYEAHFTAFKKPKSLEVLKEVFS